MAEQEKDVLEEEQTDIPEDQEECETEDTSEKTENEADSAPSEEEEAQAGDASEKGESRADKKASKKQAKLDKKAEAAKEQIAQLEDKVKRQLAEFENFRNRTEKILPVVDNFERGLATVPEDKKEDPFVDGMNRIYRQLLTELENMGVKPIEAVGQEFDPNLHNAVMQVESEEYESGVVAQELQKGYTYRDNVVRHSMVAVTT